MRAVTVLEYHKISHIYEILPHKIVNISENDECWMVMWLENHRKIVHISEIYPIKSYTNLKK